jgi:hypothetical protein
MAVPARLLYKDDVHLRLLSLVALALAAAVWTGAAHAAPADWCGGNDRTSTNRVPELQLSSNLIHVVYATASDGPDDFAADAPLIVSDVAAVDAWWQGQDPTRAPRWDMYPFPGCPSGFGRLDISFVRLPRTASVYAADTTAFDGDLGAFPRNDKQLVFYDGLIGDTDVCGDSRVLPTDGGPFASAVVSLAACTPDLGAGGIVARTAAHELLHDLGAEPDTGPPHACPPPNDGHPCDSTDDILYPFVYEGETLANAILDVGRDDYYGHSGSWWDVQDSSWLEHLPQSQLSVTVSGSGTVSAAGTALSCLQACTVSADGDSSVTLQAGASTGSQFLGWGGDCSGKGECQLSMSAAHNVTARFGAAAIPVRVVVSGKGTVVGSGLSCSTRCTHSVTAGTHVTLRARAAVHFRFAGWTGACHGTGTCRFVAAPGTSVGARFTRR